MAVVYRCVGILTVDVVVFFQSQRLPFSGFLPLDVSSRLWETSSGVVAVGVFAAEARRELWARPCSLRPIDGDETSRERILRMEDAGTSEEDDIDSQDSNTLIDHGHLARNCSIKITTPALKASVIISIQNRAQYTTLRDSSLNGMNGRQCSFHLKCSVT